MGSLQGLSSTRPEMSTDCDVYSVDGILHVFERWDIYDIDTLQANLASSLAELQKDLAPVAALSFVALLKATLGKLLKVRLTTLEAFTRS